MDELIKLIKGDDDKKPISVDELTDWWDDLVKPAQDERNARTPVQSPDKKERNARTQNGDEQAKATNGGFESFFQDLFTGNCGPKSEQHDSTSDITPKENELAKNFQQGFLDRVEDNKDSSDGPPPLFPSNLREWWDGVAGKGIQDMMPTIGESTHEHQVGQDRRRSIEVTQSTANAVEVQLMKVGLLSHPQTTFTTNSVENTICVHAPQAATLQSYLYLVGATERAVEIKRATYIYKVAERFFVRVKLPMANSQYEIRFQMSTRSTPLELHPHPLTYIITADENVPNLLKSLDHPLAEKFGFPPMHHAALYYGIRVLNPMQCRLLLGYAHFTVHVDKTHQRIWLSDNADYTHLPLPPLPFINEDPLYNARKLTKKPRKKEGEKNDDDSCDDDVDVLVSVQEGKYILQLRPRADVPDIYEEKLRLIEDDVGSRLELFLRFRKGKRSWDPPQKLAEWYVVGPEEYPTGF